VIPISLDGQAWVMAEAAVAVIDAVLELVSEQGKMAKLSASPDVLRYDCYPVCGRFFNLD
jgi:hypothetical protein